MAKKKNGDAKRADAAEKKDPRVAKAAKARATAVAAVADADRLGALLSAKSAGKLAASSAALKELATVSAKRLARHPRKIRRRLDEATADLEQRMKKARRKLRRDAVAPAFGADGVKAAAGAADSSSANTSTMPPVDAATLAQAQSDALPAADLSGLTLYELRRKAKQEGRVGYSRLSKAELVTLLS